MSTVAWDGKTLAADCQGTVNGIAVRSQKIFKLTNGDIIAFTGGIGQAMMLKRWYENEANVTTYPEFQADKDDWCRMIVVKPSGDVFCYERFPVALQIHDPFAAWGSGGDLALGAMAMGANAITAVEIAGEFDVNSGMGVEFFEV